MDSLICVYMWVRCMAFLQNEIAVKRQFQTQSKCALTFEKKKLLFSYLAQAFMQAAMSE